MSSLRRRIPLLLSLLSLLIAAHTVLAQGTCDPSLPGCVDPKAFQVRAYAGQIVKNGGKCLDYTPEVVGSSVFLNDCSRAHPVGVSQLAERMGADGCARKFEVRLRAGTKVIGVRGPLHGQGGPSEPHLELQDEFTDPRLSNPRHLNNQTFVFDGDSILLASDRRLVAKVQNSRGANGSPIVLGPRELRDSEFWEFHALDGTGREPTCNDFPGDGSCAFVHVAGAAGLAQFLAMKPVTSCPPPVDESNQPLEKWPDYDKVIVVESGPIILSNDPLEPTEPMDSEISYPFLISDGVTVRGDRRGTRLGPHLALTFTEPPAATLVQFQSLGNDVRFTGLRLTGGNEDRDTGKEGNTVGIQVLEAGSDGIIVDHNHIGEFTSKGVWADGNNPRSNGSCDQEGVPTPPPPETRPHRLRVSRNFIHHNLVQNKGYGVDANSGGFPLVDGNTFVSNRHAIALTNSTAPTGYRAWSNLVLHDVPFQFRLGVIPDFTHDFDIHGTGEDGFCGIGGGYTEVNGNTFLGTGHEIPIIGLLERSNFSVRGVPCQGVDFLNNVSVQDREDTVDLVEFYVVGPFSTCVQTIDNVHIAPHPRQFGYSNPTNRLGVGDFDGDGRQDLFLATRTAFYYSPAGQAEWRLLTAGRTDPIETLRFGDFDGDGRTDVIGKNGANIMVSWGGVGEWERLNRTPVAMTDLAVGNFDGIGGDDIFAATGGAWYVSAGGSEPFLRVNTSGFGVKDLRFGDFNENGKTDVFGVVSGNWAFSDGASTPWTPLRSRLTDDVDLLFVSDFDGDGKDDIASIQPRFDLTADYRFSSGATEDWQTILRVSLFARLAAFGKFRDSAAAGLLFWDEAKLRVAYVGSGGLQTHSRQDMK